MYVEPTSILFGPEVPIRVADVEAGTPVWCVDRGVPVLREVCDVSRPQPARSAVWVASSAGDFRMPLSQHVAATSGVMNGAALLGRRQVGYGIMAGTFPRLEALRPPAGPKPLPVTALVEECRLPGTERVLRIGAHPRGEIAAFTQALAPLGNVRIGRAGWAWIQGAAAREEPCKYTAAETWTIAAAPWAASVGERWLPVQAASLRRLTLGCLHWAGCGYEVDFRPRYWPVETLLCPGRPRTHVQVQGVWAVEASFIEVHFDSAGGYLAVNGFLMAA